MLNGREGKVGGNLAGRRKGGPNEGGSEAGWKKGQGTEGGIEAGPRKEEKAGPSNEA